MVRNFDSQFAQIRFALGNLGDWLGCHQIPERSLHIRGVQFPVCARCTGVFLGQILMLLGTLAGIRTPLSLDATLMIPMAVDWIIQYTGFKESTNRRRIITGLLGGAGYIGFIVGLAHIAMKELFHQ